MCNNTTFAIETGIKMIFDLCTIDWTAISSLITGLMAFLTLIAITIAFRSNKIARKSFNEMVYQREQRERPYVAMGLDFDFENEMVLFTITNYGNRTADKVSVKFDDASLEAVGTPSEKCPDKRSKKIKMPWLGCQNLNST